MKGGVFEIWEVYLTYNPFIFLVGKVECLIALFWQAWQNVLNLLWDTVYFYQNNINPIKEKTISNDLIISSKKMYRLL